LVVGFVAFVGTVLGVLTMLPCSNVTKANLDRIQEGMTEAEIAAIIGDTRCLTILVKGRTWAVWTADNGDAACIDLTNSCVSLKHWHKDTQSVFVKFRRRFPFGNPPPRQSVFRVLPGGTW